MSEEANTAQDTGEKNSKSSTAKKEARVVQPIVPKRVMPLEAVVQFFSADVPAETKKEDLEDPKFWAHVAAKMQMGCEIRCMWEDFSRLARVVCTFADGHNSRFKLIEFHALEKLEGVPFELHPDYEIKCRGPKRWCVQNKRTGKFVKEMIATKAEAVRELEEYLKVLNR